MDYNKTVHLPQTDFPMRAGLPKREPELLNGKWEVETYHKLMKKNEGKPKFVLHDGPPYANGHIHIGTALNKILKDIIVKHKNMTGHYAPYVPGWDTHGLPIESAILKDKKIKRDELTDSEFRDKCRDFALNFVDIQRSEFQRLGVIGDWENPYLTLSPVFEAKQVEIFGKMAEKGYIYKGMKPVYWCPHDQTALAEAEIEYADDPCTTIFVKFPVKDDQGKLSGVTDLSKTYFVIWTTTPWTIPGNYAISVNPDFDYVLLQAESGEVYILAEGLVESVCKAAGLEKDSCTVLATFKGSDFELMRAKHPLFDRESVILCGDHVTLDAGSGCVHTAPGFGAEDFQICQQYDKAGLTHIGVPVPVNAKGVMTDERYNGQFYAKGNDLVVADLEAEGFLLAKENIVHSYPHCWRCKNPIIYRATEQWFCSVDAIKDTAVQSCDNISWHPSWGKDRMTSMISERNDWCISRQRKWGVPIPIFYCDQCGADLVTPETIQRVSELFREHGSNVWFEKTADELVEGLGLKCPHCGGVHFSKESDIMDVWFDSGSTHAAVLDERPELTFPADVYLEGGDQYRGWFQSSMLTSIAAKGVAPYKQIITHGWTVDGEGKAMHKSLGNGVDPYEIFNKYGADLLRLWAASADYHADMRCSDAIFKQLSEKYLKIRNTARYILGNLNGFDPNNLVKPEDMLELDRWAVTRLNALIEKCFQAYDDYEFNAVTHAVNDFCVVDMSNFYLDIIKDRLYCEETDGLKRRSAQTALFLILDTMTKIMAPILCFTCDEIWQAMPHRSGDDVRNVVLNEMNQPFAAYALSEADMAKWDKIVSVRDAINAALEAARNDKKIGKSLEAKVTIPAGKLSGARKASPEELADLLIVSQVEVSGEADEIRVESAAGVKCPRCWKHTHSTHTDGLCPRCAAVMKTIEVEL